MSCRNSLCLCNTMSKVAKVTKYSVLANMVSTVHSSWSTVNFSPELAVKSGNHMFLWHWPGIRARIGPSIIYLSKLSNPGRVAISSRPSGFSEKALKSSDETETYLINLINKIKLRRLVSVVFCQYTAHLSGFVLLKKLNQCDVFLRCLWAEYPPSRVFCFLYRMPWPLNVMRVYIWIDNLINHAS